MIPGLPKADINGYVDWAKLQIKMLIKDQLKEIQTSKVIMTLWVRWKKPVKLAITLAPEDIEGAQETVVNDDDN